MSKLILSAFFLLCLTNASAQSGLRQYFDGADTLTSNSLLIVRDTGAGNVWQIGSPRKAIFSSAATAPNAIVTDTLNPYPVADTSRFTIKFKKGNLTNISTGIVAIRWKQKLDMVPRHSGGVLEFSKNGGPWQNAFNNPAGVYNFYGFLQSNKDTLSDSTYAFSGRDTAWRDIWFCLKSNNSYDSFKVRFTFLSDTSIQTREGWMIDNMLVLRTFAHTVVGVENNRDSKVYPTVTDGVLFIEAAHLQQQHLIKSIRITNAAGRLVKRYNDEQSRYMIDLSPFPPGEYFVRVATNLGSETFPVMLRY